MPQEHSQIDGRRGREAHRLDLVGEDEGARKERVVCQQDQDVVGGVGGNARSDEARMGCLLRKCRVVGVSFDAETLRNVVEHEIGKAFGSAVCERGSLVDHELLPRAQVRAEGLVKPDDSGDERHCRFLGRHIGKTRTAGALSLICCLHKEASVRFYHGECSLNLSGVPPNTAVNPQCTSVIVQDSGCVAVADILSWTNDDTVVCTIRKRRLSQRMQEHACVRQAFMFDADDHCLFALLGLCALSNVLRGYLHEYCTRNNDANPEFEYGFPHCARKCHVSTKPAKQAG
eukprot:3492990-Rhodomonas_salina.6